MSEDGYVVSPLLPSRVVADLIEGYRAIVPADDHGLTVDYMRPDRSVMRDLGALLQPVWEDYLPRLLHGHEPVMSTFVAKHPGHESGMFLHDDRSYVDESRARALTVWIPLADIGPGTGNGALQVVPRSHRLATGLAGSLTPDHIRPYEGFLRDHLVTVSAAAGDAVVYDTRTLHASGPNLTDTVRLAVACAVVPRGEPLLHVVATDARHRRVHAVSPAFFVEHHPREIEIAMPADCPVLWEYDDDSSLTPEAVGAVFGSAPPAPDPVVPPDLHGGPTALGWLPVAGPPKAAGQVEVERTLAAGTRDQVAVPAGRRPSWVRVDAAPTLAAGVLVDGRAANLAPGRWIEVPAGAELTLWNDGPGEAVVALVAAARRPWLPVRARAATI